MSVLARLVVATIALGGIAFGAVEARTPHFRVYTELDSLVAREAAAHLERARAIYAALGFSVSRLGANPLPVVLFRDIETMRPFQTGVQPHPGDSRGFFVRGADRNFIALAWDAPGSPLVALAHEYAHQLNGPEELPLWFREGLAEYLSAFEISEAGIRIGTVPAHLTRTLQRETWLGIPQLFDAERGSLAFQHPAFYAESWLLVHYLASSRWWPLADMKKEYLDELKDRDHKDFELVLRRYRANIPPPEPVEDMNLEPPDVTIRELHPGEMMGMLADMQRETGRTTEAFLVLRALSGNFPELAALGESLGALFMDMGNYDSAEEQLAGAIAKGSSEPRTHYRYALMLLRPASGSAGDRARLAARHARLAQDFDPTEPRYLLTEAQARMAAEEWDESARLLGQLMRVDGWGNAAVAEFRELERRRFQAAAKMPPPVFAWNDFELPESVRRALDAGAIPEPPPPPPKQNWVRWPPPGSVLVYGWITSVECAAGEKVIHFRGPSARMRLRERPGEPPLIFSAPKGAKTLPCGMKSKEVNLAYRPVRGESNFQGEVVAVVF
jgi:hypothetical protein